MCVLDAVPCVQFLWPSIRALKPAAALTSLCEWYECVSEYVSIFLPFLVVLKWIGQELVLRSQYVTGIEPLSETITLNNQEYEIWLNFIRSVVLISQISRDMLSMFKHCHRICSVPFLESSHLKDVRVSSLNVMFKTLNLCKSKSDLFIRYKSVGFMFSWFLWLFPWPFLPINYKLISVS